jgi:wyosine [tRNA(Phe)-imidazoG37] synthetase (radical SAM superfamily)
MMHRIVFPPILSRRFGLSLGVDLSPSGKQCNFDCLYCELSGAKVVTQMREVPSVAEVMRELIPALLKYPDIEAITLTANGEPTLYPHLSELVAAINRIKGDKKLLLLSNASLISEPAVRAALMDIDIVKLSLDSLNPQTFKKLDRPAKGITLELIKDGMREFAGEYKHELVIEVLVVENFNDTRDEFLSIDEFMREIKPARIDVGTIDRPAAYKVQCVTPAALDILARSITSAPVMVCARRDESEHPANLDDEEIMELLKMRPQSIRDVEQLLDPPSRKRLELLVRDGLVKTRSAAGVLFYMRA